MPECFFLSFVSDIVYLGTKSIFEHLLSIFVRLFECRVALSRLRRTFIYLGASEFIVL